MMKVDLQKAVRSPFSIHFLNFDTNRYVWTKRHNLPRNRVPGIAYIPMFLSNSDIFRMFRRYSMNDHKYIASVNLHLVPNRILDKLFLYSWSFFYCRVWFRILNVIRGFKKKREWYWWLLEEDVYPANVLRVGAYPWVALTRC
jgi:hypothetical protein